ncbi:MAG: hypothetical protein HY023_14795 [Chloroflexi bacterium]|nr:hypothetical protein [Chloroflexota bacterium]
MNHKWFPLRRGIVVLGLASLACQTVMGPATATVWTPLPAPSSTAPSTPGVTASPEGSPTPLPELLTTDRTYPGSLTLIQSKLPLGDCKQQSPFDLPTDGLVQVAYVPTQVCFNGEIGLLEIRDRLYVVQSAGYLGAFMLTDVTDPSRPEFIGAWEWKEATYTSDVKTFRQADRSYLVLSMEAQGFASGPGEPCGIAIVEVTDPRAPQLIGNYHGQAVGSTAHWCNVHTVEVDADAHGDGNYLLVSSDDTADLRVVNIRDLSRVREVGRYRSPKLEFDSSGTAKTFVHDTTIVGDRVYVSYWAGGLVILDKASLESGVEAASLNEPGSIAPEGFDVHHGYPTTNGNFVFIEDEVNYNPPDFSQLRLWDIRDLSAPKEVLALKLDNALSPPHNLLVEGDLLYVGWYQDGVRVYRYDVSRPDNPVVEPAFAQPVRAARGTGVFGSGIFDGIYGVRLHGCEAKGKATTCIYASDLTRGLLILALP